MKPLALLGLLVLLQEPVYKSFKGIAPPEIEIPASHWINAEDSVTLESLKGKVVWLEFVGSVF